MHQRWDRYLFNRHASIDLLEGDASGQGVASASGPLTHHSIAATLIFHLHINYGQDGVICIRYQIVKLFRANHNNPSYQQCIH
jgi:hypothetical protein